VIDVSFTVMMAVDDTDTVIVDPTMLKVADDPSVYRSTLASCVDAPDRILYRVTLGVPATLNTTR
jgi:hypothetical protein